jgi:hypothetical protein
MSSEKSAEKPKALSLPSPAARPTVAGRPAMTQTLVGHTAPAPPEVTAWLNALLKLDGKPATPLGEALNVAHAAPTVPAFPAVVDVPELPESALEMEPEPPAPPPLPAPVVEAAAPPAAPTVAEAAAPAPAASEAIAPEVSDEAPIAPPPPMAETTSPPRVTPAARTADTDADLDPAMLTGGRGRRRLVALALIGAVGLGAAMIVRGRHAPAPTAAAAPPALIATPVEAPAVPPPPAPPPHLELGLDPAGAAAQPPASAPAPVEGAVQPQAPQAQVPEADEAPKPPRRERAASEAGDRSALQRGNALLKDGNASGAAAAFEETVRSSPDEPGGYRGLGLAYEQLGKSAEAMDAFKRYIKLATRSRDREWAARHMYQLAHPEE